MIVPDAELWNACYDVLAVQNILPVQQVANATGMTEHEVITALMRCAVAPRYVQFRFPPLPRAAITKIAGGRLLLEAPNKP